LGKVGCAYSEMRSQLASEGGDKRVHEKLLGYGWLCYYRHEEPLGFAWL